jgi:hypothetical protein
MKSTGSESPEPYESQDAGIVSARRVCSSGGGPDADEPVGSRDNTTATEIDIAIDARERIPAIVGSEMIALDEKRDSREEG